jgi:uncharacterized protein YdeI (YjbR/CyaY-like superfamily)
MAAPKLKDNPAHVAAVEKAAAAGRKAGIKAATDAIKAVAIPEDKVEARATKAALKAVKDALKA